MIRSIGHKAGLRLRPLNPLLHAARRGSRHMAMGVACAALLAANVGCKGCGGGPSGSADNERPLWSLAPDDATAVVHIPKLSAWLEGVDAYIASVTKGAAEGLSGRLHDGMKKQLGFDPLDAAQLEKAGVDTQRGVLLFSETVPATGAGGPDEPILVLAVKDRPTFDKALLALVKLADGADRVEEQTIAGRDVTLVGRPFGNAVVPVLLWTHVGSYVLAVRAEGRPALEAALERLAHRDSGAQKPTTGAEGIAVKDAKHGPARQGGEASSRFREALKHVPEGLMAMYVRGGGLAKWLSAQPGAAELDVDGITTVSFGADGMKADSWVDLEVAPMMAGALAPAPLIVGISDAAVVYGVTQSAKSEGLAAMRQRPQVASVLDRVAERVMRATGMDFEKEVLPLLAGPMTATVEFVDLPGTLRRMSEGGRKAGSRQMFGRLLDAVHVVVTADLKDAKAMSEQLHRARKSLGERGVDIEVRKEKIAGRTVELFSPKGAGAKLGWAVMGQQYIYAVGTGRLEAVLAGGASGATAPTASVAATDSATVAPTESATVAATESATATATESATATATDSATAPGLSPVVTELAAEVAASVLVIRAGRIAAGFGPAAAGLGQGGLSGIVAVVLGVLRNVDDMAFALTPSKDGLYLRFRQKFQPEAPAAGTESP